MPFEMGDAYVQAEKVSYAGLEGRAIYDPFELALVDNHSVPHRIRFESDGRTPRLTMGIELVDGVPQCTYLELELDTQDATAVRDKDLKAVHVERFVSLIVTTCRRRVFPTTGGFFSAGGPVTPAQVKAVERMQRRRRDPNDRELLERVAAIYKDNPDAPVAAIMRQMGMSRRTAGRWAARCSEAGLLPKVDGKGKKRL